MALQERWPPDPASPSGAHAVARSGRPELIHASPTRCSSPGRATPSSCASPASCELRSALLVPLWVRGRVIGVLTWVSTDENRLYEDDDVRFAEHLARRAATAIDNAELYSQTRAAAEQLQRAVLPAGARRRRLVGGVVRLPAVGAGRDRRRLLRRVHARRRPPRRLHRRRHGARGRGRGGDGRAAGGHPRVRLGRPRARRGARPARPDGGGLRQRPARHARVRAGRGRVGPDRRRQRRPPPAVRAAPATGRSRPCRSPTGRRSVSRPTTAPS